MVEADYYLRGGGYGCPYFQPKQLAKIPVALWLFFVCFLAVYTVGRMITIFGKRICE